MNAFVSWLSRHGLNQYHDLFIKNDINLEILPELTDQDLKELGLSLGHRRKLLLAINELKLEPSSRGSSHEPNSAPPRSLAEAERRQLTVMFCDLVGSTALSQKLDPENLREVLVEYQKSCGQVIEHYGGYLAKYLGDGLLVYFGYPIAHEDDAERAVAAGLGILSALTGLNVRLKADKDIQLAVHLGIHTGLVVAGEVGCEAQLEVRATPILPRALRAWRRPIPCLSAVPLTTWCAGFIGAKTWVNGHSRELMSPCNCIEWIASAWLKAGFWPPMMQA